MSGTQPLTASTPFDPNALRAKANSLRLIAKVLMGVAAFVLLIGGYVFFNANDIVSKSVGNKELLAAAEENSKRIEDTQKKVDEIVKAVRTAQTTGRVTTGYEQLPDGNPWPQPLSPEITAQLLDVSKKQLALLQTMATGMQKIGTDINDVKTQIKGLQDRIEKPSRTLPQTGTQILPQEPPAGYKNQTKPASGPPPEQPAGRTTP